MGVPLQAVCSGLMVHILGLLSSGVWEDLSLSQTGLQLWWFPSGRDIHSQLFQRHIERSDTQRRGLGTDGRGMKVTVALTEKFFPEL